MKKSAYLVIISLAIAFTIDCQTRLTDFTIISSKNVDITNMGKFERGKDRSRGEDLAWMILFIPTGTPDLKEALDAALEATPGAVALVDGAVYSDMLWLLLAFRTGYIVEGTPLIDPSLVENPERKSDFIVSFYDNESKIVRNYYLTEDSMARFRAARSNDDQDTMDFILENEAL